MGLPGAPRGTGGSLLLLAAPPRCWGHAGWSLPPDFGDLCCSRIGGEVHSMVWDPTGERLAVILRGQSCPSPIPGSGNPAACREKGHGGTRGSLGAAVPCRTPRGSGQPAGHRRLPHPQQPRLRAPALVSWGARGVWVHCRGVWVQCRGLGSLQGGLSSMQGVWGHCRGFVWVWVCFSTFEIGLSFPSASP